MITKEDYLAVATPKEWDWWLNEIASISSPTFQRGLKGAMGKYYRYIADNTSCLFCRVSFECHKRLRRLDANFCATCMKGSNYNHCSQIPPEERVDQAIERLEAIGLWD